MKRLRHIPFAALAALAVAAPAQAVTWSAPVTVSKPHTFVSPLWVTSNLDGIIAAWNWQDGVGEDSKVGSSHAFLPDRGAAFSPELHVPTDTVAIAGFQHTRVMAVTQSIVHNATRTRPTVFSIDYANGPASGSFGPLHGLATTTTAYQPQLGMSPGGKGVISYIEIQPSTHREVVRASIRGSNGLFAHPSIISGRGQAKTLAAAAGENGDYVVAFVRNDKLLARYRRHGHHWGSIQTLAIAHGPTQWDLQAAVDTRGRAEVVWRRRVKAYNGNPSVHTLEAAYQAVGRGHFSASRIIESSQAGAPSPLIQVPGGFAVAYAQSTSDVSPAPASPRVRMLTPNAGPPLDAAPASGGLGDVRVAWSGGGGLFATWIQQTPQGDGGGIGRGAFAPSIINPQFGPAQDITPNEAASEIVPAFIPPLDRPLAVWVARPEGTGPGIPLANIHTVVRAAAASS